MLLSFILNNNGYTVERLIHGKNESYNEVAQWDYSNMAKTFGPKFEARYHGPFRTNKSFVEFIESGVAREDNFQVRDRSSIESRIANVLRRSWKSSLRSSMLPGVYLRLARPSMSSTSRRALLYQVFE